MCWSSGKDSAFALHALRQGGAHDVVALLTSLNEDAGRVSMHGVRDALLDAQAAALGLPCVKVRLPADCPNQVYEARMGEACRALLADGVTHMAFGDLYLEDVRAYRERMLAPVGLAPVFPIWGLPTAVLARHMVRAGIGARLSCIDTRRLPEAFAGRAFDAALLDDFPPGIDPCGENGEFHTFCHAAPGFTAPIAVRAGDRHRAGDFLFTDILPAAL